MNKVIWVYGLCQTTHPNLRSLFCWNLIHNIWKRFHAWLKHVFKENNVFASTFSFAHHLYKIHHLTHTKITASVCIQHLSNTDSFSIVNGFARYNNVVNATFFKCTFTPVLQLECVPAFIGL